MINRFANLLESGRTFLLTAHENPDADAIGALLGLAHYLRHRGKTVRLVITPEFPSFLRFMDPENWIEVFAPDSHSELAAWPDSWVLVDASETGRLGKLLPTFQQSHATKICLDHHLQDKVIGFDHAFVDSSASASSELVYTLAAPRMAIPPAMAQALYAGIMDDTGCFRFSNTTPHVLRYAAELLERHVDPAATYQALYHQGRPERLQLLGRALTAMRFLNEGRYASTLITQADLQSCGAIKDDLEGLANKALEIKGVEVSCLLHEISDQQYKISLRSRGRVDVNAVCRILGGGGHKLASGAKVDGPAKAAQNKIDTLVIAQMTHDLGPFSPPIDK